MAAAAAAAGRRARPPVRAPAESSASSSPACARGAEGLGVRDPPPHAASAPLAAPVRRPPRSRGGPAGRPRRVSGRAAAGRRAGAALSPGAGGGQAPPPAPGSGAASRAAGARPLPPPALDGGSSPSGRLRAAASPHPLVRVWGGRGRKTPPVTGRQRRGSALPGPGVEAGAAWDASPPPRRSTRARARLAPSPPGT